MKVRTNVNAGGRESNHAQSAVAVKTGVNAEGAEVMNHGQAAVKTGAEADGLASQINHAQALLS